MSRATMRLIIKSRIEEEEKAKTGLRPEPHDYAYQDYTHGSSSGPLENQLNFQVI